MSRVATTTRAVTPPRARGSVGRRGTDRCPEARVIIDIVASSSRHAPADDELVADADTTSLPSIYSAPDGSKEAEVLEKLRRVIDPDFGEDIANRGFARRSRWTRARVECCSRSS